MYKHFNHQRLLHWKVSLKNLFFKEASVYKNPDVFCCCCCFEIIIFKKAFQNWCFFKSAIFKSELLQVLARVNINSWKAFPRKLVEMNMLISEQPFCSLSWNIPAPHWPPLKQATLKCIFKSLEHSCLTFMKLFSVK